VYARTSVYRRCGNDLRVISGQINRNAHHPNRSVEVLRARFGGQSLSEVFFVDGYVIERVNQMCRVEPAVEITDVV
jgi:hypothetical protein